MRNAKWWCGFAEIDEEVAAVLAFVISSATLLAAQDDETGRCQKVCGEQVSRFELYKHRPQGRECQRFLACARNDDTRESDVS